MDENRSNLISLHRNSIGPVHGISFPRSRYFDTFIVSLKYSEPLGYAREKVLRSISLGVETLKCTKISRDQSVTPPYKTTSEIYRSRNNCPRYRCGGGTWGGNGITRLSFEFSRRKTGEHICGDINNKRGGNKVMPYCNTILRRWKGRKRRILEILDCDVKY